jgi:hypothetical protein
MKKIWNFLKIHLGEDFRITEYSLTAALLIVGITINYKFDVEDRILDEMEGWAKFSGYYLFYGIPYYLTLLIYQRPSHNNFWAKKQFWLRSQAALLILTLDVSAPFLTDVIERNSPEELHYWLYKVTVNGLSFFTVLIPLMIFYYSFDTKDGHLYGLAPKKFDVKPYFTMLLIMLPLLISASFHRSFLQQYPMYNTSDAHTYLGVSDRVTAMSYELAYGFDFITLELLFRGFMVIGIAHIVGRRAVLAMAVVYCFLHFGKPMGEAISSIFGGYILGIIALETRSVWGGIIVHLGIAWLMEFIGYIQHNT